MVAAAPDTTGPTHCNVVEGAMQMNSICSDSNRSLARWYGPELAVCAYRCGLGRSVSTISKYLRVFVAKCVSVCSPKLPLT